LRVLRCVAVAVAVAAAVAFMRAPAPPERRGSEIALLPLLSLVCTLNLLACSLVDLFAVVVLLVSARTVRLAGAAHRDGLPSSLGMDLGSC